MVSPKISVIVPVYNAERFLCRCMQSIYSQTFTDYEIILVNDGSTDDSLAICNEYAKKDDRITVIDKENGGAGSARNMGIEVAKGEYLAFPDVDDWFEKDMYADLYALAKSGDYDVVFSGENCYLQKDEGLEYSHSVNCNLVVFKSKEECRKNVMELFPTTLVFDSPCNKLYKRKVAIDNGVRFSDTRRCQDAMFNLDFYDAVSSVVSTDKAYYNYIQNTVADTNRKFPKNYIDINVIYFTKLIDTLSSWGMYVGDVKKHYDTSFVIAVYGTAGMFDNPRWNFTKQEKEKYVKDIFARKDIQDILKDASLRDDVLEMAEILITQNYSAFMKNYRREKFKNKLRGSSFLRAVYRLFKK